MSLTKIVSDYESSGEEISDDESNNVDIMSDLEHEDWFRCPFCPIVVFQEAEELIAHVSLLSNPKSNLELFEKSI